MHGKVVITAKLMGIPSVKLDGKAVSFHLKSAEALFYYLLICESASREKAALLLDFEGNAEKAYKRLRDSLYFIKKYVHPELILSDGRRNLKRNPSFSYETDIREFCETEEPESYGGEFLEGFQLEYSTEYEAWLLQMRERIWREYVHRLEYTGMEAMRKGELKRAERCLTLCLEEDPFCESAAVCLMEVYQREEKYHWAADVYQKLKEELADELGISPLRETTKAYHAVLEEWNRKSEEPKAVLPHTLQELGEEERKILDILSAFPEWAAMEVLVKISRKPPLEILYSCQELCRRSLICQKQEGEQTIVGFIRQEQQEFIYREIPPIQKRILHFQIAEALTAVCAAQTPSLDAQIMYHYQRAGDYVNAFRYNMRNMERQIDLCYEVLPSEGIMDALGDAKTPEKALKMFDRLMEELDTARRNGLAEKEFWFMKMKILYEKSCFCCYKGLYEEALSALDILLTSEDVSADLRIGANRQMVYYGIQIYRTDVMEQYIEEGLRLAVGEQNERETAIFLRLKGLLLIWQGECVAGRRVLEEAIRASKRAFRLNPMERDMHVAYAYNYMGESYRLEWDFKNGARAYKKAIELLEQNGAGPGLPVFYANYARMTPAEGNYSRMTELLTKGRSYIEYVREPLGRTLLLALSAMQAAWNREEERAADYLKQAKHCAEALRGPQEMGYIFFVQAVAQKEAERKQKTPIFRESGEEYARKALKYLEPATAPFECHLLRIHFSEEEDRIISIFE